jgi:outer membrane protein OmpA-like peptidoglycan-associated protein
MRRVLSGAAVLLAVSGGVPQAVPGRDAERFLVFFDEFSANLTLEAQKVVADAAQKAKSTGSQAIRVEARASATGSTAANHYLAQTRSQIVTDELAKDGIARAMVRQAPIGQTGSGDPSVAERRVDIVLER